MVNMRNKIYLCSVISIMLLMVPSRTYCQSSGHNYVAKETMLDESGTRGIKSVQYYDGLGRPSVLATGGVNTSEKYNYSVTEYDVFGHESKVWQPAVGGKSPSIIDVDAMSEMSVSTYKDECAYSGIEYDVLGRPIFKSTSGELWNELGNKKGIKTEYITNDDKEHRVRWYKLDDNGNINKSGEVYYEPFTLTGEKTTDEDGHTIEVYKDMFDNVVLERRDGNNDTYYVYEGGLLRVVVPPLFQKYKTSSLLYKYKYDGKGRCIEKTLPGCQPIKYWYDKSDRIALMQDSRMKSAKKFRFFKYDKIGRLVVQGLISDTVGYSSEDAEYIALLDESLCQIQTDNSSQTLNRIEGTEYFTYSKLSSPTLEIVNYYDYHACLRTAAFRDAKTIWNLKPKIGVCTTTFHTAQIVTDNKGDRYFRVMYYDEKGRCTETNSSSIDGYFIKTNTSYSFTDKPTKTITKIYKGSLSGLQHTIIDSIEYNAVCDLPEKEYIKLDGNPEEWITENVYDDLGRLVESKSNNGAIRDLYEYDLHGWLTSHKNYDDRIYYMPTFKENLYYADGPNSKPCYNGDISAQVYSDADDYYNDKGYLFGYDGMDRMTSAKYMGGSDLSIKPRTDYSEDVTYNENSSVLTMKRKGNESRYGYVDNLTFSYTNNKLYKVSDSAYDVSLGESAGFVDGYDSSSEYRYDDCGSLTCDKNKGVVDIRYDFNGMPERVLFENGSITEYVYTADGVKLKTIHRTAVDGIVTSSKNFELTESKTLSKDSTLYVGSLEIDSSKDKMYHFANGYIDIEQGHVKAYCYYAKDHLGNVRHVDKSTPGRDNSIVQITNYYPFGGVIDEGSRRGVEVQNKLYNGKEYDSMHGLNLYDYSARQYDPALGQFTSIDPRCEKSDHISPYVYCAGNPVKFVDPTGMIPDKLASALMAAFTYFDEYNDNYRKQLEKMRWMVNFTMNSKTGFKGAIFSKTTEIDGKKTTEYAVAFAGTDFLFSSLNEIVECVKDCHADVKNYLGIPSAQQVNALHVANLAKKMAGGNELTFVGHSLGGELAALASMFTGCAAITFNPASVNGVFKNIGNSVYGDGKVTQYRTVGKPVFKIGGYQISIGGDPISNFQNNTLHPSQGTVHNVKTNSYMPNHSIETFVRSIGGVVETKSR